MFDDPQLGLSQSILSYFYVDGTSEQFSQELRVQSDYDDKFNFSLGAVYIDVEHDNSVILSSNLFTAFAQAQNLNGAGIGIDQNTIPDGNGHNYYHAREQYKLKATSLFGEAYYKIDQDLKATLGLRYTKDKKSDVSFPILLFAQGQGFPDTPVQEVTFKELTGRLTIDWQATEESLIYGSISRGYKGGGFNIAAEPGIQPTFEPEFVDAIEIGSKSSLDNGRGLINLTGFYYNYSDYQIVNFINLSVVNENVDAAIYGLEVEGKYLFTESIQLKGAIGYLNSHIKNGQSLDTSDLIQGETGVTRVRSFDTNSAGSACIVPTEEVIAIQTAANTNPSNPNISGAMGLLCTGVFASPNSSIGNLADLTGNQLPYSPEWTVSLGLEYYMYFEDDWEGVLMADYYVQDDNFARTFNTIYDKIDSYDNLNLSYSLLNDNEGVKVQFYVRNLLSKDAVTNIRVDGHVFGNGRIVRGKEPVLYGVALTYNW